MTADTPWSAFQDTLTARGWIAALIAAWLVFKVLQALYNVSPFHPLSKIPGPKLAAATYLPEFYYDVILVGRYTHAIKQMHEKYGPIVRINPNELHCADMSFSDEIYAVGGRKRDKPFHQVNGSAAGTGNAFGTPDHDLHRARRAPVAKFFSRAMIARLEQEVHDLAQTLCNKLLAENKDDKDRKPFEIAHAYSCFTSDAISSYCFGEAFGLLSRNQWQPNYREATLAVLKPVFFFRFFPILVSSVKLGKYFIDCLPTDIALLIRTLQIDIPSRVQKTKNELDAGIVYDRPTIFADLLQSELDDSEKKQDRLVEEAVTIVNAGTETTSWALAVITYFLLSQPETLAKLQDELKQVVDDPCRLPSWTTLEQLPYLGAVINEGLRLSYGVSSRTARVPTGEDLVYRGEFNKKPTTLVLPRGYAIGMSAAIAHHDESVFPDSHTFAPERWIDEDNKIRKDLEKSMIAFSKGSRGCLGKNLALCELYLSLAALVLRVMPYMRLYETTDRDVRYDHDMFIPMTESGKRPIAIPATSSKLGSPFLRAFPPILEQQYHLPREVFLRFLDDLNRAAVASPPVQILGLAGSIVSMIPLHTAQIVGSSVNAAATLSTYAISKSRSELCISTANKELFMPRGLKAEFTKLDVVARFARMPILNDEGKIEKNSMILGPLEDMSAQSSVTVQQRRLQALEPWIAPLDLTPLPELHVPDNFVSKMHASTSERQRKKEEKKMTKDRAKAHDDWTEDSRKAREDYEKEMRKIGEELAKAQRKHVDEPRKLEKELKKLDREREKCEKEYEKEMRKVDKDRRKDDKEEEGVRKVLWLLIRPIGNGLME
ncbi:cytochrome P450 oxidoreductase [Fusarium mexicanum]|uniref:Cytochrome P450 oxidoreductase n=1 Tax=Fusarium mexicanum TaxID=751941 RepID=A0A8H5I6S9_9HYPO|nr:cytochrome P450 oxidoreductase [Fusarium mexicanum]